VDSKDHCKVETIKEKKKLLQTKTNQKERKKNENRREEEKKQKEENATSWETISLQAHFNTSRVHSLPFKRAPQPRVFLVDCPACVLAHSHFHNFIQHFPLKATFFVYNPSEHSPYIFNSSSRSYSTKSIGCNTTFRTNHQSTRFEQSLKKEKKKEMQRKKKATTQFFPFSLTSLPSFLENQHKK
jgi:hypothetical protein